MADDEVFDLALDVFGRWGRHGSGRYILNEAGEPEECEDLMAWSAWMESGHRVVCHDRMESYEGPKEGAIFVSTVFLGVDYNFAGVGPPVLWETMVFQGLLDGYCRRYTSKEAAYEGHQAICQEINATLTPRLTGNNQPVDPD